MIRLEALTKTYATPQGSVTAVDHVSFEVEVGQICVLLGPSGCGKTTTLRMINRLVVPTSGKVFIGGHDTDSANPVELRAYLADGRDILTETWSYTVAP